MLGPSRATVGGMDARTEHEMDAHDAHHDELIERIHAGDLALVAVAAGEAIDPAVLTSSADAMQEIITDPSITGATWTIADVDRVRQVRDMLGSSAGQPSPEARALAASCRLIFIEPTAERAA